LHAHRGGRANGTGEAMMMMIIRRCLTATTGLLPYNVRMRQQGGRAAGTGPAGQRDAPRDAPSPPPPPPPSPPFQVSGQVESKKQRVRKRGGASSRAQCAPRTCPARARTWSLARRRRRAENEAAGRGAAKNACPSLFSSSSPARQLALLTRPGPCRRRRRRRPSCRRRRRPSCRRRRQASSTASAWPGSRPARRRPRPRWARRP